MSASQAQLKANAKYKATKTKKITLEFYPSDYDLYEYMATQEKKQTYIKELIRKDMNKKGDKNMKNFKVVTGDYLNLKERTFVNATDVIYYIESNGLTDYEVEWKTPITEKYAPLLKVENGKRTYTTEHFKLPVAFEKLG